MSNNSILAAKRTQLNDIVVKLQNPNLLDETVRSLLKTKNELLADIQELELREANSHKVNEQFNDTI